MLFRAAVCLLALGAGLAPSGEALAGGAPTPVVVVHVAFWHAAGRVTLIDRETLAILGSAEISRAPWPLAFDPAGTSLLVLGIAGPGPVPPPDAKAVMLFAVDARTAAVAPLGEVGRTPSTVLLDPSRRRLYVADARRKAKRREIGVYDVVERRSLGVLATVGRLVALQISPDGGRLYAICRKPARLVVLDAATGAEQARLDAGEGALAVAFDAARGLAYVLGAAGDEGTGRVAVLRGAAVVTTLDLPGRALGRRDGPDGTPYLLVEGAIVALAPDGLAVTRVWPLSFDPGDLAFDPAHALMFAGEAGGSLVAEMSTAGGAVLAEHPTGSAGRKLGKRVGEAAVVMLAFASAAGGAAVFPPVLPTETGTFLELAPDGATLYVLNAFTNDVSVWDVATRDVVGILHTGGRSRFLRVPGEPYLWVHSRSKLVRIDPATRAIDRTIDLPTGMYEPAIAFDPERGRVWILSGAKVLVADLRSAEIVATIELPARAVGIWIDAGRGVAPGVPGP